MKALLVRVGVDNAYGKWNAPVDPVSNRFVYVPIPERLGTTFHLNLQRRYEEFVPAIEHFCRSCASDLFEKLCLPAPLTNHAVHLDPDFAELTYGDDGGRRGSGMRDMEGGDVLAFYAGLKPVSPCGHQLLYALIGLYVVDEVIPVEVISADRWKENAHTRKDRRGNRDLVVRAKREVSGRLERCIPIGERRNGAYRVCEDVLSAWGGLSVKDGFIQRSAVPPSFLDPERFYGWFRHQNVPLVQRNN